MYLNVSQCRLRVLHQLHFTRAPHCQRFSSDNLFYIYISISCLCCMMHAQKGLFLCCLLPRLHSFLLNLKICQNTHKSVDSYMYEWHICFTFRVTLCCSSPSIGPSYWRCVFPGSVSSQWSWMFCVNSLSKQQHFGWWDSAVLRFLNIMFSSWYRRRNKTVKS